jgi:nitroimidazol reductase NimA-like FMN-containing flavoprotein (pyridoxamine 5'-phosphate oxidase superfamily)
MTAPPTPSRRGRFEELAFAECMELLSGKQVGRVAMCGPDGPLVFPVNYTVHDGGILFRTAAYTQMAQLLDVARAAFEVDEIDDFLQCGWSVLALGQAHYVDDPGDLPGHWENRPEPWASGVRKLFIRIDPVKVTGRRVHPD